MIKHSPEEIHCGIDRLLNHMVKTSNYPNELEQGILVPLPNPWKKQGPLQNIRPIIVLTILGKILAVIMSMTTRHQEQQNINHTDCRQVWTQHN